jgi:hypothetical protein
LKTPSEVLEGLQYSTMKSGVVPADSAMDVLQQPVTLLDQNAAL